MTIKGKNRQKKSMQNKEKRQWSRIWLGTAAYAALLILLFITMVIVCSRSNQSTSAFLLPITLEGEYSQDGGVWMPLEEDTDISAFDGDLILRGSFSWELSEGTILNFYLNHISMSLSVNGEQIYITASMQYDTGADLCGKIWAGLVSPGIGEDDLVEIHLHNSHRFGNRSAYRDFLDSLYPGPQDAIADWIGNQTRFFWTIGLFVLVVALVLTGTALGFLAFRISYGNTLLHLGLLTLFAGGYILLDTPDISLRSHLVIFNTYGRQVCIMFAGMELNLCTLKVLTGNKRRAAGAAIGVLGLIIGLLLAAALTEQVLLYDTAFLWMTVQALVCGVLIVCCICEFRNSTKENRMMLLSFVLVLAVTLMEFVNAFTAWWQSGICIKTVFLLLMMLHLLRAFVTVPTNYRSSLKAKELEEELKRSRIVLSMSQIRTHFIFNILNAISGMCKYDPEKADEIVVRFARYLRGNVDVMQEDNPISFSKELEHLEDYVALEQIRFGDKIVFSEELEIISFFIPPLVLQPLVENAIRHGLLPKPSGGTIQLHTWSENGNVFISIADDGIGFDPEAISEESSVGLNNVRFRLRYMMNGRLDIESSLGNGTKATITIPCKGQNQEAVR